MHTGISLIHEPWINRDAIRGLGEAGICCYRYPEAPNPRTYIFAKNVNIIPLLDIYLDILNTMTPTFRNSVREEVTNITLCTGSISG